MTKNLKCILGWVDEFLENKRHEKASLSLVMMLANAKAELKEIEDFKNSWLGYNPEQIKGIVDERYCWSRKAVFAEEKLSRLEADNAKMRKALEFYANKCSYKENECGLVCDLTIKAQQVLDEVGK